VICEDPYVTGGIVYGCGQCMPCRYMRRRVWSHRIMLEASQYEDNCFVTLTYSDDMMPEDRSLEPTHLTKFLKRLRHRFPDRKLRYFGVGEYSDAPAERPHYHLIVFNMPTCEYKKTRNHRKECCKLCSDVREIWGYGRIELSTVSDGTALYVSGYVVKKMTRRDDIRLNGRHPEFARMSLGSRGEGGIGAPALHDVASEMMYRPKLEGMDVAKFDYDRKGKPLGQYLTKRLRKLRGLSEDTPESVKAKAFAKMYDVRESAFANSRSLKEVYLEETKGALDALKGKLSVQQKRRPL